MKRIFLISAIGLVTAAFNFFLFVTSYNRIATPYLHEEQRVENADFIMSVTLSGYILIAAASTLLIWFLCRAQKPKSRD